MEMHIHDTVSLTLNPQSLEVQEPMELE